MARTRAIWGSFKELRLILVIIAVLIVISIIQPGAFSKAESWSPVMLYTFAYAIIGCGMTILLVSGGFDLSVGSVMAFSGMVAGMAMNDLGLHWILAVIIGLASGALIGLLNGTVVAKLKINPFITTLATMVLLRGVVKLMSGGQARYGFPDGFNNLGQAAIGGVQVPIIVCVICVIVFDILLRHSRFFRQSYYMGGNEESARLSGIAVDRVKMAYYSLSGFLAAMAGILSTARYGSASVTAGEGVELKVITAVIIGGASLSGGVGTIFGAALGALLMAILVTAINIIPGLQTDWEQVIVGGVLVAAVLIDQAGKMRRR